MKTVSTKGRVVLSVVAMISALGCGTSNYTDERGTHETCAPKLLGDSDEDNSSEFGLALADDLALVAAVDYTMVKAQVFMGSCTSACHAPGKSQANIDLSTYAGAKANITASITEVKAGTMPVGGIPLLSAAQIALLEQWKAGGLLEIAVVVTPVPTAAPTTVASTGGGGSTTTGSGTTGVVVAPKSSDSTTKRAQCLQ